MRIYRLRMVRRDGRVVKRRYRSYEVAERACVQMLRSKVYGVYTHIAPRKLRW